MSPLGPIDPSPYQGTEMFHEANSPLHFNVLSFWQWAFSDLVTNATRGVLAEYLVAQALGVAKDRVREEWAPFDMVTANGIKVEVKSAAYIQAWQQKQLSRIIFRVPMTRAWNKHTNRQSNEARRQADVYVFALLAHADQRTLDSLDVCQWEFYVLPTSALDGRARSQHSITLPSLKKLAGDPVGYRVLRAAVAQAAGQQRSAQ